MAASSVEVLELELEFDCGSKVRQSVLVTAESESLVRVPEDCPAAGAEWKVSLRCAEDCFGKIRASSGRALASLLGPSSNVGLIPAQRQGSRSLGWVRVAGVKALQATAPELLWDIPLTLTFRGETYASSYVLDPSGAGQLQSPMLGSDAQLRSLVEPLPDQRLLLQLWADEELVFRRKVALYERVAVECGVLGAWCKGTANITVEPHRPQQLSSRAGTESGRRGRVLDQTESGLKVSPDSTVVERVPFFGGHVISSAAAPDPNRACSAQGPDESASGEPL